MRCTTRQFRAGLFELEGRLLLSGAHAKPLAVVPTLKFVSNVPSNPSWPTEVVHQQDGQATLTLWRSSTAGSLQAMVTTPFTGPGSLEPPVDKTLTFADGQQYASLSIPLIAGAAGPGNVDIPINVVPIGASSQVYIGPGASSSLDLEILSDHPTAAPQVVTEETSSATQAVHLVFNKPMDSVQAANVNNYAVTEVNHNAGGGRGGLLALFGLHSHPSTTTKYTTPLSATYDPSTDSVTLILKKERVAAIQGGTSVSLVNPTKALAALAKASVATKSQGPGLGDLQGNSINASTKPGKVGILVDTSAGGNYGFPL